MKLLIETSLQDLLIIILSENNKVLAYYKKPVQKKGDVLPLEYAKLLKTINKKTSDLKQIYVTKGPGSFTGSRIGLVFAKTICQILKVDLFTLDTLSFLSQGKEGTYYIDARSNLSYKGTFKNNKMNIELANYQEDSHVDYEDVINNAAKYLRLFKRVEDITKEKVLYIKEPTIGG